MGFENLVDFTYATLLVDLDETLSLSGKTMTVWAPINAAFDSLHLKALLRHHISCPTMQS
jgi:hypothetical protein